MKVSALKIGWRIATSRSTPQWAKKILIRWVSRHAAARLAKALAEYNKSIRG